MPAMDATDRHRRRADRRSAATCPGWSGRRPGCASSGCSSGLRARPGLGGRRAARRGRPADRARVPCPIADPRAKNRAAICEFLPRERDLVAAALGAGGRADAPRLLDPRRRLHRACRSHGRAARRPTGRPPRHRLVRRARRLQHARHDAVGERLGDAVRDALRPRRPGPRRGGRRTDGHGAGRRAVRRAGPRRGRVADARGVAHRPFRGRDARARRRHEPRSPAGRARSRRASTGSTSRSTWIASTRRAAGR